MEDVEEKKDQIKLKQQNFAATHTSPRPNPLYCNTVSLTNKGDTAN